MHPLGEQYDPSATATDSAAECCCALAPESVQFYIYAACVEHDAWIQRSQRERYDHTEGRTLAKG